MPAPPRSAIPLVSDGQLGVSGVVGRSGFRTADAPLRADVLACVHCGLCLNACPTYRDNHHEADSPRGRIYLMRAVQEGRLALTPDVTEHIDSCVGCRACESVCPAGVQYGSLLESTRAEMHALAPRRSLRLTVSRAMQNAGYGLLTRPAALRLVAWITHAYVRWGVQRLVRGSGVLRLLPRALRIAEELLPADMPASALPSRVSLASAESLGLLRTCAMDLALPGVTTATHAACAAVGLRVIEPRGMACCGALHLHAGRLDEARGLARQTIAAFEATGVQTVATNSAGCGSAMKEYGHLLRDDPDWAARAATFAARVHDISEILAPRVAAAPPAARPGQPRRRVVYQDACHLAHAQRLRQAPRMLLAALPDIDLVEMAHPDWCCGSGGVYNLLQIDRGERLLADKMAEVSATAADVVAVGNPGCLLQIGRGARRQGRPLRVVHPVQLVAEAYAAASPSS